MGTLRLPDKAIWRLSDGIRVDDWNSDTIVECETPGPIEDMPWVGPNIHVVSDRLRALLEKYAPGAGQYLPVRMMSNGLALDVGHYWVVNWLHLVDCIDWKKSVYEESTLTPGRYFFFLLVIDPQRIQDHSILRIRHFDVQTLIRDEIRRILESENITGPQYYNIWQSNDKLPDREKIAPDPDRFGSFPVGPLDPIPANRIRQVEKLLGKTRICETRHDLEVTPAELKAIILELGNAYGVDWSGDRAFALWQLITDTPTKETGTHMLAIQLPNQQKRKPVVVHYFIYDVGCIRVTFWGPREFTQRMEKVVRQLRRQ